MLELGEAGSLGYPKGGLPVLRDGKAVAALRAANCKEAATAVVGDREWVFTTGKGDLLGRWSTEPEDAARLRARAASCWTGTWALELEGRPVELQNACLWRGTHRYFNGGRQLAESGPTGFWSPRPTLTAEDALPLHQQVFLLWLELVISRRNTAVAAGTSAAVIGGTA